VVILAIDESTQTTTMHVQVGFQGQAEDFAWVLPVPAQPELMRSTPTLFNYSPDRPS